MDNSDQTAYWNGAAGRKWVRFADLLDEMLSPFAEAVIKAAELSDGERVIDVGCGGGVVSLLAAHAVGEDGGVVGVDVSEPLLALARERASEAGLNAEFVARDASAYRAEKSFDVLLSRFGVMFFSEPAQAFANLKSNMHPSGRLAFACWQGIEKNYWARLPVDAARPYLKEVPARPPAGTPGPFAFGDPEYVESKLKAAGWSSVALMPWQGKMALPGATTAETASFLMQLGPLSRLIEEQGVDDDVVHGALQERLEAQAGPDGRTFLEAAIWTVTATAG